MIKYNINTLLFKSLIETDFLLINVKKKNKNKFDFKKLNLIELLKNLKQFCRLLQYSTFLKKKQYHVFYNNFFNRTIYKKFLINFNFWPLFSQKFKNKFKNYRNKYIGENISFFIQQPLINNNRKLLKLFKNKIFLVYQIFDSFNPKFLKTLYLYNNLDSYKKIIFIISFITSILKL